MDKSIHIVMSDNLWSRFKSKVALEKKTARSVIEEFVKNYPQEQSEEEPYTHMDCVNYCRCTKQGSNSETCKDFVYRPIKK